MNPFAKSSLSRRPLSVADSDDNKSLEDEEFDDTGMDCESPYEDIVSSKLSSTNDQQRTNSQLTNEHQISDHISSTPRNGERYLKFPTKNRTPLQRQSINSRSLNNDYFGDSDEEQRTIIRGNELVSSPRSKPDGTAIRASQPTNSLFSAPSSLKFKNVLDIPASSQINVKSDNNLEALSGTVEGTAKRDIEDGWDKTQRVPRELIISKLETIVDHPYRVTKVQSTRSTINEEISRDSIIEKVNHTLDSLSTSIRKTRTIKPDITSTPKSKSIDIKRSTLSDSLQSEFVDHFLKSPEVTSFKTDSRETRGLESNNYGGTWPSDKWLKLRQIVESRSITRSEAIGSSFLLHELECSKKELILRYDFLQQIPKKKSRKNRISRIQKGILFKSKPI